MRIHNLEKNAIVVDLQKHVTARALATFQFLSPGLPMNKDKARTSKAVIELFDEISADIFEGSLPLAVGFCGGRSIQPVFSAFLENIERLPNDSLAKLRFFLVDERVCPRDSDQLNFNLIMKNLYQPLAALELVDEGQFLPFLKFDRSLEQCCEEYSKTLDECGGFFHSVFCGVGEDGHVASLFPDMENDSGGENFFPIYNSPKPPLERLTSSLALLQKTKHPFLLFFGEGKREVYNKFVNSGSGDSDSSFPALELKNAPGLRIIHDQH